MEFEWDADKEHANLTKHGVPFTEAVETFLDRWGIQVIDEKHSHSEKRYYWIGKSSKGRLLTTRFVQRGTRIRIIGSAVWRKFRKIYETAKNESFKS